MGPAAGVALVFLGYCAGLLGALWITGKNVGFKDLFGADWPPSVAAAS